MKTILQNYRGSVAFAMSGRGPKPVFAPPGEGGEGGDNKGGDNGNGNGGGDSGNGGGDGEGAGGAAKGGGAGGDGGSARQLGGLFGKRSSGDGNQGDGGSGDGGDGGSGDAPKLPEKFLSKDKTVNVDALTKAYLDLEKSHGELKRSKGGMGGGEVPKTADEYFAGEIKLPDGAENFKGITSDDPGLKSWAEVCMEEGIPKDAATRLATKMMVKMNGHAPTPIDPDAEFEALGPNAQNIVDGLFVWVDGKAASGDFSEDDIGIINGMMETADGARLLAKFRNMSGERPIPINPGGGSKGMSQDQWKSEMSKAVAAKDYARQEELDAMLDKINPDGA